MKRTLELGLVGNNIKKTGSQEELVFSVGKFLGLVRNNTKGE